MSSKLKSGRRNLVIVRAGDTSLHQAWLPNAGDRSWDLIVSYFGNDPDRYRHGDVLRIDGKGPKWPALYELLVDRIEMLQDYDYIWLPDDDIACLPKDIEGLFNAMRRYGLAVGQPALSRLSYFSWCITLRNPLTRFRATNFVETMVPCFQRDILIKALPAMAPYVSGWGMDWVWPTMAGLDFWRNGIIDEVAVTHTRPFGGPNYQFLKDRGLTALDELIAVSKAYGIQDHSANVLGIITFGGLRLKATSRLAVWLLRLSYWVSIGIAYAERTPQRWDIHKGLRQHFADPANMADHADSIRAGMEAANMEVATTLPV